MKSIYRILSVIAILGMGISCTDDSLDPLNMSSVKKGIILALRGDALNNLYVKGKPVAEFLPKVATGTEKFVYETEFLAEDNTTLASVDLYVLKNLGGGATDRKFLKTIDGSAFAIGKYPNPSATITITIQEVFTLLGIPTTFPLDDATIQMMLTTYKFGINLESDINLKDGTKILAADMVAAGLYQSNQFYPSMRLNYAVTDYCAYDKNSWGLTYDSQESGDCCNSKETNKFTQDLNSDPSGNTYVMDNWWGDGVPCTVVFTPSTTPDTQIITIPKQSINDPNFGSASNPVVAAGSGTYNQCLNTMTINCTYTTKGGTVYAWLYVLTPQ